jgi:hypothetical protein
MAIQVDAQDFVTIKGETPASVCGPCRNTTLYSVASNETHDDAVIRILGEVPRKRPHSPCWR